MKEGAHNTLRRIDEIEKIKINLSNLLLLQNSHLIRLQKDQQTYLINEIRMSTEYDLYRNMPNK